MGEVLITMHAYDRFKERAGIKKKAAKRMAVRAYTEGIRTNEINGELSRFMQRRERKGEHRLIRVYGEMVYCFAEENDQIILLTVMHVPSDVKRQALSIQRKFKVA